MAELTNENDQKKKVVIEKNTHTHTLTRRVITSSKKLFDLVIEQLACLFLFTLDIAGRTECNSSYASIPWKMDYIRH